MKKRSKAPDANRGSVPSRISGKIPTDFRARSEKEQEIFTQVTWCDSCLMGDLGMLEPSEYRVGNRVFLEGKCSRCGSTITSEILKQKINGVKEDVIWPIRDKSKPALTYLPRKKFTSILGNDPGSIYGSFSLRTPRKISRTDQIVFWALLLVCLAILVAIWLNRLSSGA